MNILHDLSNAGKYDGIEHRICEITTDIPHVENVKLTGRFFYLSFRNKTITEKEFAKFVYDQIIRYCIPRWKNNEALQKVINTQNERFIIELHDQARDLFVKSLKKKGAHLGEPGELISFIILEYFFNAPQIACKMFLKTSEQMPVHGSDSVHIRMNGESDSLELIWGESKMYSELSTAFDEALKSIDGFTKVDSNSAATRAPRERDIDIIKDMPNVPNEEMKKALCNYFDPYSEYSNKWSESFCCFIGFDYPLYRQLESLSDNAIEAYFREQYQERIKSAYSLFANKISAKKLNSLDFILVLLPFMNLDNFRSEFYRLLGVDNSADQ